MDLDASSAAIGLVALVAAFALALRGPRLAYAGEFLLVRLFTHAAAFTRGR